MSGHARHREAAARVTWDRERRHVGALPLVRRGVPEHTRLGPAICPDGTWRLGSAGTWTWPEETPMSRARRPVRDSCCAGRHGKREKAPADVVTIPGAWTPT
ncbi:hypothetical protein GCM10027294_19330 [Marinactinospora endophytica]